MLDGFGREASSLRLAVTQRCNQNCIYCHNEGQIPSSREMTLKEVGNVLRAAASVGVRKVKLTGGEPLLREDMMDMVAICSEVFQDVSLTTNGVLLAPVAQSLREAGLTRINISLDTLDRHIYKRITGRDQLSSVLEGIDAAEEAGLHPIKLNTVLLRGLNDSELEDLMGYSAERGAILQLIELTTRREGIDSPFYRTYHHDLGDIEGTLRNLASEIQVNDIHNRRRYLLKVNGWKATVEVVRPMTNRDFCANCTRIRVTSDGRIKPCLLTNQGEIEALDLLGDEKDEVALRALFEKAISSRRPYWD